MRLCSCLRTLYACIVRIASLTSWAILEQHGIKVARNQQHSIEYVLMDDQTAYHTANLCIATHSDYCSVSQVGDWYNASV